MFRPLTCFADALYAWGDNSEGEFGDGNFGSATSSTSPVATLLTSGVTFIAGGEQHSLAVQNGAAYAWGDNNYGQVGVGNDTGPYITPQNPSSLSSGMTAVAGGADQSMAIMSGAVYSWGFNQYGEVGDGTSVNRPSPVRLSTLSSGVTAIAAGGDHSMAIKNGAVFSWGYGNDFGEVGDGTQFNRLSPVAIGSLSSGVTAIAAGFYNGLAVKNGAVFAWGNNYYGTVGDGTNTDRYSPTPVISLTSGVTAVACGYGQALALKGGAVYAWGDNEYGQVGNSSTIDVNVPTLILPASDSITAIATGAYSSYALSSDGSLWVWGFNSDGQLGIGNTTEQLAPTHLLPPTGLRFTGIAGENLSALATAAPVPEPTNLGIIGIGCAMLLRRRNRRIHIRQLANAVQVRANV